MNLGILIVALVFHTLTAFAGEYSRNTCMVVERDGVLSLRVETNYYRSESGPLAFPIKKENYFHDFPQFASTPRESVGRIKEITRTSKCELLSHRLTCEFSDDSLKLISNTADQFEINLNVAADEALRGYLLENRICRLGRLEDGKAMQTSCRLNSATYEGEKVLGLAAATIQMSVRNGILTDAVSQTRTTTSLFLDFDRFIDSYIRQLPGMLESSNCPRVQSELTRCEKTESHINFIKTDTNEVFFQLPIASKNAAQVNTILNKLKNAQLCELSPLDELACQDHPPTSCQ